MHSRAYLLLKRDLENLKRFPMEGLSAGPCNELNMFDWDAKLHGLENTPWEGGVFHLRLQFSGEFNSVPPAIQFMTIPFHPNIDPADGTPHCHLLSPGGWSEAVSVPVLLISLQALLSSPELEHTVNTSAAELLQRAPHTYQQMARDCVSASLRVDAGLPPYEEETDVPVVQPPSLPPTPRLPSLQQPHAVSFDDYLSLWRGIATSKPLGLQNGLWRGIATSRPLGHQNGDKRLGSAMDGRSRETSIQQKLRQHHLLQHGQGGKEGGRLSRSSVRRQMEKLKLTYAEKADEEENVDQLLHWTKNLDGTVLSTPHSLTTPL